VHTRLKRLVTPYFRPGRINLLTPRIQTLTNQLLDNIESKAEFDAVSDLAYPLTLAIIAEILGIPIEHQPMLKAWSDQVFSSVRESLMLAGAFLTGRLDTSGSNGATWRHDFFPIGAIESSVHDSSADAIATLRSYFIEEISQRRASPGDDLISVLVSAQDATDTSNHPDTEGKHQAENHRATTPAASCIRSHNFNSDGPDPLLILLLTCPKGSDDIHAR
jgi:cytochrome P450